MILYSLRQVYVTLNLSSTDKSVVSKKLNANAFDGASGPDLFDLEDTLNATEFRGFLEIVASEKGVGGGSLHFRES